MEDKIVQVEVVWFSNSNQSILDKRPGDNQDIEKRFAATPELREQALKALRELGFEIIVETSFGASIAGSAQLVRRVFGEDDLEVPASLKSWVQAVRVPPRGELY